MPYRETPYGHFAQPQTVKIEPDHGAVKCLKGISQRHLFMCKGVETLPLDIENILFVYVTV